MFLLGFFLGLTAGGFVGLVAVALCRAAARNGRDSLGDELERHFQALDAADQLDDSGGR